MGGKKLRGSLFGTVSVMIIICLVALVVAWCLWGWWAKITTPNTRSTVSLATVGGLGGLVALVVAYRKQAMSERNEVDEKLADAVHLLGEDKPSTRIAGVYALTNVGDRYPEQRQRIIDILCGYLRTKREDDGPTESTIINVLKDKLKEDSWPKRQDINFDLHGATITEDFDLNRIKVHRLICVAAKFNFASFIDIASFNYVEFNNATFNNKVIFYGDVFNDVTFGGATFNGDVSFSDIKFNDVSFNDVTFAGDFTFDDATFNKNANIFFYRVTFKDRTVVEKIRKGAMFKSHVTFDDIKFKDNSDDDEE